MAQVSSAAMTTWIEEYARFGENADDLAELASPGAGRASSDAIPLHIFVDSIERIAARVGSRSLGWTLGERHGLGQLGDIGRALFCSSTLGSALRRLTQFFALVQDASEMRMSEEADHCAITYRILDPDIWPRHQDSIYTLGIIAQLIRRTSGVRWEDVDIFLETDDMADILDLEHVSGAACHPSNEANLIRFPRAWLDLPMSLTTEAAPPDFKTLNRRIAQKRRSEQLESRLRAIVYQHLGVRPIDQEAIARQLGMSSRTLRRRLAEEGLSFQHVVDDCRMRQAAHEFRLRNHVSIAQTALRLGYSEHSTFTRAFSRWSGMSPQRFIRSMERKTAVI